MDFTRSRSCKGKQRHESLGLAQAALRSLKKRGLADPDARLAAYFCIYCRHYHVGHRPPKS